MSVTLSIARSSRYGNAMLTAAKDYTSDQVIDLAGISVPKSTSSPGIEVDVAFPYATIKSVQVHTDHDVTIKTNAFDAAGGQTLLLKANADIDWQYDRVEVNPFTINVSKFFITNLSSTNDALVSIRVLLDVTPA